MCRQRKYPSQLSRSPRKLRRHATDLAALFALGNFPTARSCGRTHKRREQLVSVPESLTEYLRTFTQELGERILQSFPPLYAVDDRPSPLIARLLRKPYPAQILAIMGLVRRWQQARAVLSSQSAAQARRWSRLAPYKPTPRTAYLRRWRWCHPCSPRSGPEKRSRRSRACACSSSTGCEWRPAARVIY